MSGIDAVGRSNRAGNASEAVEEKRASVDPGAERRAAEAAAERRRNGYFGGTGAEGRSAVRGRPVLATDAVGGAGVGAGKSMDAIASEVLGLRAERRSTTDPLKARALDEKIHALSCRWCELARARGMKPPTDSFDPSRASDAELASALLWTEVGNTYPVGALVDGGVRFQRELHLALIVRSPFLLNEAIAKGMKNDPALLSAMYKELRRLGDDRPCAATDTLESLAARRAEILRRREADRIAEERSQKVIGLDGRIGTPGQVTSYELEQGLIAANPGSLLGTIGAGISASRGGSIEDRRKAGQAGNAADGLVGFWQPPLDPNKAPPPTFLNERPRKEIHAR